MDWHRRSRPRISVQYHVRLLSDDNMGGGTMLNLSPSGCQVRSSLPLEPGSYVAVDITVPHRAQAVGVELSIVRWEQDGRYGLEFVKYAEDARDQLLRLLGETEGPEKTPPAVIAAAPTLSASHNDRSQLMAA
ncbi:MAG: PilZ domain-containing protein [Nitrospiraceae bacterium]